MNENDRKDFVIKEIEAIYGEFNVYVGQLVLLKPFLKDLIAVAKGEAPKYNLDEIVKKK